MIDVVELLKMFTKALPPQSPRKHSITLDETGEKIHLNLWLEGDIETLAQTIFFDETDLLKDVKTIFDDIMMLLQSDSVEPKTRACVIEVIEKNKTTTNEIKNCSWCSCGKAPKVYSLPDPMANYGCSEWVMCECGNTTAKYAWREAAINAWNNGKLANGVRL